MCITSDCILLKVYLYNIVQQCITLLNMYNICCNSAQIVTRFPKANPLSRMKAHFSIRQGEENFFQVQRTSNTLNVGYTHQRKHAKGNYLMMITQTDLY